MAGRQVYSESEKICLQELIVKYHLNSISTIGAGNPNFKKVAWARLTEEFNSIEGNSRRTEAQLKKLWDNLKTRRKQILALEKRQRMRTGGGPFHEPSTSQAQEPTIDEALSEVTNVELQYAIDSDSVTQESHLTEAVPVVQYEVMINPTESQAIEGSTTEAENINTADAEPVRVREQISPHRRSGSRQSDYGATTSSQGARNIRARVIVDEFNLRQENYKLIKERDEELHKLKVAERQMLLKVAEEQFHKAQLERVNTEKLLEINLKNAEEVLLYNRARREKLELEIDIMKK